MFSFQNNYLRGVGEVLEKIAVQLCKVGWPMELS